MKKVISGHSTPTPMIKMYLKRDAFEQSGRGVLNSESSKPRDSAELRVEAYPSIDHTDEMNELAQKVYQKLIVGDIALFLDMKKSISYRFTPYFDDASRITTMDITALEFVKFCAQIHNLMMDAEVSVPQDSVEAYQELGMITEAHTSTPLFRSGSLYRLMETGQRRCDGMPPKKALGIFEWILNRLILPTTSVPADVFEQKRNALLQAIQKMIYLKEIELSLLSDKAAAIKFANYLFKSDTPTVIQAGHFRHSFYVEFRRRISGDNIHLYIVIHNFNGTALQLNKPVEDSENYFFPYVFKLSTNRFVGGKRKHNSFEEESKELAAYVQLLLLAHCKGGEPPSTAPLRSVEPDQVEIPRHEQQWIDQLKQNLFENRAPLLTHFTPRFFKNGSFNLEDLHSALTWDAILPILRVSLPAQFDSPDFQARILPLLQKNQHAVFEGIQTVVFLGLIYDPKKWLGLTHFNLDDASHFPPYALQLTGNCTIHNMKAGLYSAIDLDSRNEDQRSILLALNMALQFTATQEMLGFDPGFLDAVKAVASPETLPYGNSEFPALIQSGDVAKALDPAAAETHYRAAIKKDRNNALPYAKLALLRENTEDLEKALVLYSKAIDRCRTEFSMLCNRGVVLMKLNRPEAALKDLDLAIRINGRDAFSYSNRAQAHYMLGNKEMAIQDLTKVLELKGPDADVYFQIGGAHADMKNPLAEANFNLALAHGLSDIKNLKVILQYSAGYKNRVLAEKVLIRIKSINPLYPEVDMALDHVRKESRPRKFRHKHVRKS